MASPCTRQRMNPLVAAIPYRPPATPIPVMLLHPAAAAEAAVVLARLWNPIVPAATIVTVSTDSATDTDDMLASLIPQFGRSALTDDAGILAGVCGAEAAALRLAFAPDGPAWSGVLVCGRALPLLAPLTGTLRRTRLRLVWDEFDPLPHTAALAELLRCYRAAGVDAQGSVTARREGPDGG